MGDRGNVQNVLWDVQQKDQRWERGGTSIRKRRGGAEERLTPGEQAAGLAKPDQQSAPSFHQTV